MSPQCNFLCHIPNEQQKMISRNHFFWLHGFTIIILPVSRQTKPLPGPISQPPWWMLRVLKVTAYVHYTRLLTLFLPFSRSTPIISHSPALLGQYRNHTTSTSTSGCGSGSSINRISNNSWVSVYSGAMATAAASSDDKESNSDETKSQTSRHYVSDKEGGVWS